MANSIHNNKNEMLLQNFTVYYTANLQRLWFRILIILSVCEFQPSASATNEMHLNFDNTGCFSSFFHKYENSCFNIIVVLSPSYELGQL